MEQKWADLHIHTNKSDGIHSVEEIFKKAKEQEISAIAITDHDTVAAIEEAMEYAKFFNIEFVPAVELSAMFEEREIHIVGLYIDWKNNDFINHLLYFQKKRVERAINIVKKLKENKVSIEFDELYEMTDNLNNIGRLHIARLLLKKGYIKNIKEAFDKFLSEGKPAYIKKARLSVKEAIDIIKKAKGISILAHPGIAKRDYMIETWRDNGLDGIEVFHPDHTNEDILNYLDYANKFNLLIGGGSDFHGEIREYSVIGKVKLPYEYYEKIKEKVITKI